MGSEQKKRKSRRQNDEIFDERFVAATNRPQFQKPKEQASKVVLGERFASVLTDPRFRVQEKDKYGRKAKKQSGEQTEELSAFYMIEKDEEKQNDHHDGKSERSDSEMEEPVEESDKESSKDEDPAARIKYLTALSRGELSVSSSSDDEEEDDVSDSSDQDGEDDAVYGKSGILDPSSRQEDEVPLTEIPSPYIAVMDMDWKHVRAVDLFAILASFAAPGGVRRVQIFPSNYGLERMAKEAVHGPPDLWKKISANSNDKEKDDDQSASDAEPLEEFEDDSESQNDHELYLKQLRLENEKVVSDFDTEKLREYEASKLKYYFAIVEFSSNENADKVYKEVDGFELEHSSAAMDLRSISLDEVEGVVKDRQLRDEATMIPSNYQPPDFVVNALQQSSVQCTWEDGDEERQRKLTSYNSGPPGAWGALAEQDDLRAYVASDASGDEEEVESGSEREGDKPGGKASRLRKILGLEGSGDESEGEQENESPSDDDEDENAFSKQVTFIPRQEKLHDKICSKLESKHEKELTPWEKYQEKRKGKRRELRQARRKLRNGPIDSKGSEQGPEDDDMYGSDPEFGRAEFDSGDENVGEGDDFFLETTERKTKAKGKINSKYLKKSKSEEDQVRSAPSTKEELELLLAGDNDEEDEKDYDMRGIHRIEKNKDKKLRGSRKLKETKLAATVSGRDFKIDTKDKRFAAVLAGTDDRFGIDRTDPNFKQTDAMKEILAEQTKRRKAKKRKVAKELIAPDVTAVDGVEASSGAAALSCLVMNLKAKVAKRTL